MVATRHLPFSERLPPLVIKAAGVAVNVDNEHDLDGTQIPVVKVQLGPICTIPVDAAPVFEHNCRMHAFPGLAVSEGDGQRDELGRAVIVRVSAGSVCATVLRNEYRARGAVGYRCIPVHDDLPCWIDPGSDIDIGLQQ
jgi:hypothetical protein